MTGTALDLITASLKRSGVLSGIETPTADLAQDALARLNELIETWSTEALTLWTQITIGGTTLPVVMPPGQFTYTVGPGGDLDCPTRPAWIDSVSWLMSGSGNPTITELKLTPYRREQWEAETVKLLDGPQSTHYFYRADWPIGFLHLWPRPTVPFSLWVYIPVVLTGPVTLNTVFSLPPGYSRALRDWLAIEMAPELGRPVDGALMAAATDAKAQLQRVNFRPRVLQMPVGMPNVCPGAYDWRVDE